MGACFSSSADYSSVPDSALVISPRGELRPYSTPVFVSDVLHQIAEEEEEESAAFFLCNSDNLWYDGRITPLDAHDELDAAQIYFVLPVSKLGDRLAASEMAALAVKASVALNGKRQNSPSTRKKKKQKKKSKSSKISPFVVAMESSRINVIVDENKQPVGMSRSGSIRKARLAVRSFKLRLSTIYETDQSH
ncbi:hypothetical protein SSX86_033011 [Deinandra increscens subsp. villosa]|uniref:Uncharacterized protein n=1 Tax=Deinandra increscens subsp. villosa TaxID=3103831 RepID=A0AAP0C2M0_9ASTR